MYERPYNPYGHNIAIIKDYFKSKSILVLGIMNIVAIIISVVNSLASSQMTKQIISGLADYFDKSVSPDGDQELIRQISQGLHDASASGVEWLSVLSSVSIFSILSVVALFLIYFKSRSEDPDVSPLAGFTLLYVIAIFAMIGAILLTVGLIVLVVLFFFLYAEAARTSDLGFTVNLTGDPIRFDSSLLLVLAIILAVVFAIAGFFLLFSTVNRVRYLSSVRSSMKTVELSRKGAKPYGVFCVISAVCSGISLISSIPTLFVGNKDALRNMDIVISADTTLPGILSVVASLVALVIIILQAKIALGYAKYIDDKKFGYNEPAAPYTPAAAAANTQQTPYSYLAQQNSEPISIKEATFVNPYLNDSDTQKATEEKPASPSTCPACGAQVDTSAPFCGQCGTKL